MYLGVFQLSLSYWFLVKFHCSLRGYIAWFLFFFFLKVFLIYLFIYLFIYGCVGSSFLCEGFPQLWQAGPLLIAVRGPLTIAASPVAENRLQTRRLSNRGPRAQSLRGMRDLPRPGLEPVSPALAGRLSTTAPPGKPSILLNLLRCVLWPRMWSILVTVSFEFE